MTISTTASGLSERLRACRLDRLVVLALVAVLVAATVTLTRGEGGRGYVAYFETSQGIYAGDEVRVLGVKVGTITEITPTDRGARIAFEVDGDVKVPADAKALIVAPSLVSARYVQLTPQYTGGAQLAAGAEIPLTRTAVPVEFDEIKSELDELASALGPDGVNSDGSLSHFVTSSRDALDGKGADINATLRQLSATIRLLDTGRHDIFGTVRNLQRFVTVLAASDQQIRVFARRLDSVAAILARNRHALRQGMRQLVQTVGKVEGFVGKNRQRVVTLTRRLSDTLLTVAGSRDQVEQILHVGPSALRNLYASYHAKENSIAVGLQSSNTHNLRQLVCGAVAGVGPVGKGPAETCVNVLGPILDAASGELPLSTDALAQLEEILGLDQVGAR
jgi:phospholipid/cholesterol/gamma-HCH transport system substrate-binding protein